jgi:drug/metabolite transporter (DMT)-like permease
MPLPSRTILVDRRTIVAALLLLTCGSLWGAMPVLSKIAADVDSHPVGLSLLVNAMGTVVCACLCWWRGLLRWPTRAEWHFFFCWAFLYSVLNQVLIYWLSAHLDAALVSIFTVLEGLVIFAAAAVLRLEKPNLLRCCGLLTGLLGVSFLLLASRPGLVATPNLFVAVGLVIPLSYAAESLYIAARRPPTVHPLLAVMLVMGCSLPLLFVLAALGNDFMPLQFPPSRSEIVAFVMMLATLLANLAFFSLIAIAGSVFAGQLSYFNAICGVGWGVAILGEKIPAGVFISFGLIILGLLMVRPKCDHPMLPGLPLRRSWPAE